MASRGSPLVLKRVSPRNGRKVMAEIARMIHTVVLTFLLGVMVVRFCHKSSKKSEKKEIRHRKQELIEMGDGGFVAMGGCAFDVKEDANEVVRTVKPDAVGDFGDRQVAAFEDMASTFDSDCVEVGYESESGVLLEERAERGSVHADMSGNGVDGNRSCVVARDEDFDSVESHANSVVGSRETNDEIVVGLGDNDNDVD